MARLSSGHSLKENLSQGYYEDSRRTWVNNDWILDLGLQFLYRFVAVKRRD